MHLLAFSAKLVFLIAASGILQAIVLAAILYFHPKSDKSVNVFLSLYILSISILMFIPSAQELFPARTILYLLPFPLLIGPFLYLYVRSFKEVITWRKAWPHLLLFFAFLFVDYLFIPLYFGKYPASRQELLLNPAGNVRIIIRVIRIAQMIVYYFLAQGTLTSYRKSIQHLYSEVSQINLSWVRWLINGYLFLIVSLLILFYFVVRYPDQFDVLIVINAALITPYIYLMTFKGLTQRTLWQMTATEQKKNLEKEIRQAAEIESLKKDKKKDQNLRLQQEAKFADIVSRISDTMRNKKLYQETELTLQMLAQTLGLPSYQVSQAINEGMNQNFYDLINTYRVEEAKRLLLDPGNRNYTILSVGFEAGFNSKTTFNTVFKKFTGLTPTEYREKERHSLVST